MQGIIINICVTHNGIFNTSLRFHFHTWPDLEDGTFYCLYLTDPILTAFASPFYNSQHFSLATKSSYPNKAIDQKRKKGIHLPCQLKKDVERGKRNKSTKRRYREKSFTNLSSPTMAEPIRTETPQNQQDSSLPLSNLQIKAIFFAIFVVFLPFFASQAPDFVKQALSNKIWELFHLLLVGIAVAYGLFSTKGTDQETEKGNANEADNRQSYISDMLDGLPVFNSNEPDNLNVQSWSSMYNPNEPVVVVENEIMDGNAQNINKPLFLPIRSLNPTARQPALHEPGELFQNDGDAKASDTTNEEEKGDNFNPPSNSNWGHSKNKSFRSLSAKQPNNGPKITPENFMCEQNSSSSIGRPVETVRSKSSNAMDELIKTLEESENEELFNEEEESSNSSSCVTEDGTEENEVDKKADEFIAKFREQIRQQRMQCRRRPTGRKGGGK